MTELITNPVSILLNNFQIDFEQIIIPLSPDKKPIRSLEALLSEYAYPPGSIVRSILFRTDAESYSLLAIAGANKADWAVLRKHLNERRLTLADPSEVAAQTGYVVGAVPPLALPVTIRVLVDESLKDYSKLIIGSGVLGYAFGLSGVDLCRVLDTAEFGSFGKKTE